MALSVENHERWLPDWKKCGQENSTDVPISCLTVTQVDISHHHGDEENRVDALQLEGRIVNEDSPKIIGIKFRISILEENSVRNLFNRSLRTVFIDSHLFFKFYSTVYFSQEADFYSGF